MTFYPVKSGGLVGFRSEHLLFDGIQHIFSTRLGPDEPGVQKELNLGMSCGFPEEVRENFRCLSKAFGFNYKNLVLAKQTHSDIIHIVKKEDCGNGIFCENRFEAVDALVTNVENIPISVFFADCVPILLADPVKRVVAACHSGWRGTAQEISRKTAELMQTEFGSDPKDIRAAIGPCLCQKHFETSDDVFEAICAGGREQFSYRENGKYFIDLKGVNRLLLESAGVCPEHIDVSDLCGVCRNDLFFSYRKEHGKTGRLAAVIELCASVG